MAVAPDRNQTRGSFFDLLIKQGMGRTFTPSSKNTTVLRPHAQIAADGSIIPAIIGWQHSSSGPKPDISNIVYENVFTNIGFPNKTRWTGCARVSDRPGAGDKELPIHGAYIRIKGRHKKGTLSDQDKVTVNMSGALMEGSDNRTPLRGPETVCLLQAAVFVDNDKALPQPVMNGIVVLRSTAAEALARLVVEYSQKGIDLFDPQQGYQIAIHAGEPMMRGNEPIPTFAVSALQPMPLPPGIDPRLMWQPWDKVLNLLTWEGQLRKAVEVYGPELMRIAYPDEMIQYFGAAAPAAPAAPYGHPQQPYGHPQQPYGQPQPPQFPGAQPGYAPPGTGFQPPAGYQGGYQPQQPISGAPHNAQPGAWSTQPAPIVTPPAPPTTTGFQPQTQTPPPATNWGAPAGVPAPTAPPAWNSQPTQPPAPAGATWGGQPHVPAQPPGHPTWGGAPVQHPPAHNQHATGPGPLVPFPPGAPQQPQQTPPAGFVPSANFGVPPAGQQIPGGPTATNPEDLVAEYEKMMTQPPAGQA